MQEKYIAVENERKNFKEQLDRLKHQLATVGNELDLKNAYVISLEGRTKTLEATIKEYQDGSELRPFDYRLIIFCQNRTDSIIIT